MNIIMNNLILLFGGVISGILIGLGIGQIHLTHKRRELDEVRPMELGYDPNNPINRGPIADIQPGEIDEYGFYRV